MNLKIKLEKTILISIISCDRMSKTLNNLDNINVVNFWLILYIQFDFYINKANSINFLTYIDS